LIGSLQLFLHGLLGLFLLLELLLQRCFLIVQSSNAIGQFQLGLGLLLALSLRGTALVSGESTGVGGVKDKSPGTDTINYGLKNCR